MKPKEPLLSVPDALARVLHGAALLGTDKVAVSDSLGRTLTEPVSARRTQPPFASSAMDGYAVRAEDATSGAQLTLIGEAAAGHLFSGTVGTGQTVRIFTGGAVPDGADSVLIQENTERAGDVVHVKADVKLGQHIRAPGIDFHSGDVLLTAGTPLSPRGLALAAATGHTSLEVARKPRVAIIATGDELVTPGAEPGPGQITASNNYMIASLVAAAGGEPMDLGIVPDTLDDIQQATRNARAGGADILVTTGGASVGEHDLVQQALRNEGMELDFWRIAMRPGRPMMYGRLGTVLMLGLPGNPVSSYIGAVLFLIPLIRTLLGRTEVQHPLEHAVLASALPASDWRADHLRGTLTFRDGEPPVAAPFPRQDSSIMRILAEAECLIVRPAEDPAKAAGDSCRIIRLGENL
jgi:molybdopterin molybdotransferase